MSSSSSSSSSSSIVEDASTGSLGPDFLHARPLWNGEVCSILERNLEHRQTDPPSETALKIIKETLEYVKGLDNFISKESIDSAHSLLTRYPITQFELALIANLKIDDSEECQSLIPTIKNKMQNGEMTQEQLENILNDLKQYQNQ